MLRTSRKSASSRWAVRKTWWIPNVSWTELRTEGYDVVPSYDNADMVIVNTCGFIDSAVQESLEAIGESTH
ncbi:Ribosomal protein S12 methylthiotransferase RimO [Leclercia adecarboxylata]|uniref:Ribosomal protein S12 methylthiotransferase RimO n=1 Tax=Leclercia adecarboxylata TaxID=83655 RepID=A0A4U9HT79_9ENTR|nr:Ribosomal protein S12 methylthiotransferase RimO [Leclercia adecarboxylata]